MTPATERRVLRDLAAGIAGALAMTAVIAFAQWLDARERAFAEHVQAQARARAAAQALEHARSEAARAGYQDGLDRIRCRGGWRIDTLTGRAIDVEILP